MAGSPDFKVYFQKEYIAACKHVEDAAALVAFRGEGSTIRHGHRVSDVVWTEGSESQPAAESYDHVAEVVYERIPKHHRAARTWANSPEIKIYEAQSREDARARAEGREPRLIATVADITDGGR